MIVKIPVVLVLVIFIKDITSVSISKVYVQNGPDYPAEYVQYGTPYNQPIAQLTAAPTGSIAPYSANYVPCGTPCIYPGPVASVVPSASIVQYQAPNLPVVVEQPKTKPSGYEYQYSVYDEQTGDHKTQRELSDGSLVRGGYSFLQPDGFIRDVQYVADDVQGFNAVVKNYLPVIVKTKKPDPTEKPEPCPEDNRDNSKADESKKSEQPGTETSHENLKEHSNVEQTSAHHDKPASDNGEQHQEDPIWVQEAQEKYHENPEPQEIPPKAYEIAYVTFETEAKVPEEYAKPSEVPESQIKPEVHENVGLNTAVMGQDLANSNVLVPYNDIIRCVQAALSGVHQTSPPLKPESPLTYIILNKPC